MKSEWILNGAMVVLVACALVVTGLVVRRELRPAGPPRPPARAERVAGWREYAAAGQRMGPVDAPVTVVEFSDFQCPYCAVAAERLGELRRRYPRDVALVYRHYPLPSHAHAETAARAGECAAEQGRFEPFHDALFAGQDSIGLASWGRFAEAAGVPDTAALVRCAAAAGPSAAIARDTAAGRRLGVAGTPTLLVNDVRLQGAPPLDTLVAYVERALRAGPAGAEPR